MEETKFELSVSTSCYTDKNKISWKSVKYQRQNLTISEFVSLVKKGHCFCQCFNTKVEVFGVTEKRDSNFMSGQMVFVDIDDCQIPLAEFVGKLSMKPTVVYTTPNNHTEKSNWLYRFRLCYLLEEPIPTVEAYGMVYDSILRLISKDVPSFRMKDNCGRKASQQFGGNALSDCELIENSIVYSLSDFPFQNNNVFSLFLLFSNGKTHTDKEDIEITDYEFISDTEQLKIRELLDKYRDRYQYFDHTELHFENGYALIPEDYQEIYRSWYICSFEKNNGEVLKVSTIKRLRDKENRRYKLFIAGLIMKKIMPTITYEHLLYNLFYEVYHYYDNTDKVLNNATLTSIAKGIIQIPIEDIRLQGKCKKRFVVDKSFCAEYGIKANSYKNTVRKMLKDEEIGSVYDCSMSVKDNLCLLNEMGIKVSKTKLYDWCKENGINTKGTARKKSTPSQGTDCCRYDGAVLLRIEKELTKSAVA